MKKRGKIVWQNVLYILLVLIFLIGMYFFIDRYQDGAAFWEEFYAEEIGYLINKAEPGTEVNLDVSELSALAVKNGKSIDDMIYVNNVQNSVTVSVREGKGQTFRFFNDVDIVDWKIERHSRSANRNSFVFRVKENQKEIEV